MFQEGEKDLRGDIKMSTILKVEELLQPHVLRRTKYTISHSIPVYDLLVIKIPLTAHVRKRYQ